MTKYTRLTSDTALIDYLKGLDRKIDGIATKGSGDIVVTDPATGVETIIGELPDGTYGIQPFVGDVTPPPVATVPTVTVQPGLVTVRWDGKFVADADMPRDFEQVNVIGHKIEDGATVSSQSIGLIRNANSASYINEDIIAEDETWQFSLESEDFNGNKADLSQRSPIITMIGTMSPALVEDKLQELRDEDTVLTGRADQTQTDLASAQALADALLAKGQNLVVNGDFDAPIVAGKPVTGWPTLTLASVVVGASDARTGTQYLRAAPTTSSALAYSNDVTSAVDRTYRAEYWVKLGQTAAVTDATASVGFYFVTTKLDGTSNNAPVADTTVSVASLTTSTWTKVTKDYTVTIPVSKIKFGPRLTGNGNVYFIDSFKVTDVTEALAAQLKADSAFANAQQAATAAGTAQTSADSKNRNWYQATAPAGISHKNGDTWFDTDDDNRIYVWNATAGPLGTGAWVDMRDKGIAIANTAASGAQLTADGKNKSFYEPVAPTNVPAGTLKKGDLWFNTAVGQGNRLSTWDGFAWQTTQDMAATMIEVAKKGRTFTGGTQPALEFRNTSNIWIDTSLGDAFAITKRWDTTLNDWVPVKDAAIAQAITDAGLDAQAKADAAYTAAINAQGYSKNPSFDNWSSTLPDLFTVFGTGPTKETSIFLRGPNAARFNCTDATTDRGLNWNGILSHAPNLEFYTVELSFYLASGTSLNGAGVLLDWVGLTPSRSVVSLSSLVPTPVTGKWYTVSKVLRRPTTSTGTWTGMDGYLMANYSGTPEFNGKAVKDIIFDWLNVRPSTAEEILSYTAPTTAYVDQAEQDAITAAAAYATQKASDAQAAAIADTSTKLLGKNKTVWSTSPASGTTGYIAGDTWFQRDATGAVIAQWEFTTSWQPRTVSELVIGGISAGKIIAGVIDADRIGVNTITSEKIFVGDFTNLASDGSFIDVTKKNWTGTGTVVTVANEPNRLQVLAQASGNADQKNTNVFTVTAGEQIYGEIWVYGDPTNVGGGTANMHLRVTLNTGANAFPMFDSVTRAAASGVWTLLKGVVTIPANAKTALVEPTVSAASDGVGNKYQFRLANVRRMATGSLIVDGALDAKTITGPTIQTEATASRGIKLTASELAGYDSNGNKNFSLTTGGTLAIKGEIQSGSSISGATLSAAGIYTNPASQRGVKIQDTGIRAWDINGNATFVLDATTGQVEVPGLKASSIKGSMIEANTIGVSNIAVSDLTNFAPSLAESPGDWTLTGGMNIVGTSLDPSGFRLDTAITSGTSWAYGPYIAVQPDESLYAAATVYRSAGATGAMYLRYYFYDKNKTVLAAPKDYIPAPQSSSSASGVKFEVTALVPAGAAYARLVMPIAGTGGNNSFYGISGRRMNNGKLIVDGAITTDHMKSNTIDAKVIATGTLTGDKIEAGAISAEKLTVGIGTNLIPDPGFQNPGVTALRMANSYGTVTANATTGNLDWTVTVTSNQYFRATGVTQSVAACKDWIPVLPGEKYAFSVDITLAAGMTGDIRLTGRTKDQLLTTPAFNSGGLPLFPTLVAGQQQVTYYAEVPAGIYWMLPEIRVSGAVGTVNIAPNSLSLRLRAVGELIVDGAITSDKIKTGAVDAGKLAAGAVTAVAVGAKSITTDKLVVSSTNNLLIEPDFSLNGISWTTTDPATNYITINSTAGRGSTPALRFTGTTSILNSYNLIGKSPDVTNKIAVDSDNRFRASFWVKSTEALPINAVKLAMRRWTSGTAQSAVTMVGNDAVLVPNVWTQFQAISPKLASNVIALDFYLIVDNLTTGGITDIDAVSVTRAADGKLVVDGEITATKLDANLVLATKIIAGDEAGIHAEMSPAGFKVYAPDPGGGPATEVVRLGVAATDDYFAITKSNGDSAASISSEGVMYALDLIASRSISYKGDELQSLLDDKPRGVVAAAYRDTSSAINGGTTNGDIPYLRLEAFMEVGRVYKISTSPMRISRDAGASVTVGIKYNSTGTATTPSLATVSSTNLTQSIVWDEANAPMLNELFALTTGSSRWVSFLIWLGAVGGNAGFRPASGYPVRLIIEDVGPNRNTIGSGVSVDGNATPPAAKNTYTKQYYALGSSNYLGNGSVYNFDAGRMYQGLQPGTSNGNLKSLAYFPSMTGDLSGAIVNNIRVYFMFDHWYYNTGGTARITLHGQSGLPATFPTTYGTPAVSSGGWPKPGDRWVTIPTSYYGGFVNGTYKGVALEGDNTYGTYGIARRPVIEISYTK